MTMYYFLLGDKWLSTNVRKSLGILCSTVCFYVRHNEIFIIKNYIDMRLNIDDALMISLRSIPYTGK